MNPWEELPDVWRNERAYLSWLRGQLRRIWSRHPIKRAFLTEKRRPYTGENKRQKWEFPCASCEGWFPGKQIQVDHVIPAGSFRTLEEFSTFGLNLLHVSSKDLQILCKRCHEIKSYADAQRISLEKSEALLEARSLLSLASAKLRELMLAKGASEEDVRNAANRRKWVEAYCLKRSHENQRKS